MSFFRNLFSRNSPDTFVVPEGVRIEEWRYELNSGIAQSETGMWIANFGANPLETNIYLPIRQLETKEAGSILFLLSSKTSEKSDVYDEILNFWRANTEKWVVNVSVADVSESDRESMTELSNSGIAVFAADFDGTAMVEIHGPDDVQIGMAGKPFSDIPWE